MKRLLRYIGLVFFIIIGFGKGFGQSVRDYCVQVSAQVLRNGIRLSWPAVDSATTHTIFRKKASDDLWPRLPVATLLGNQANSWIDTTLKPGQAMEYRILRRGVHVTDSLAVQYNGHGYIYAGIQVPEVINRGKLIFVYDTTFVSFLLPELLTLSDDLEGDGWDVIPIGVGPNDKPDQIRRQIQTEYNADPNRVKAVYLFGHVPVPYSGRVAPDGHTPDHEGAWPADGYYGEMNGTWTDFTVNFTKATRPENHNRPRDGKLDNNTFPGAVELQVGRVDMAKLSAFSVDESGLLKRYLQKSHAYRHHRWYVRRRALIADDFQTFSGGESPFAATGWRNFSAFFGADSVEESPWHKLATMTYSCAYGCGGGMYDTASRVASTTTMAQKPYQAVFTGIFGSYKGDWDSENNLMRAVLAADGPGLCSFWAGRPFWPMHHMALGLTVGAAARLTMNYNPNLYVPNFNDRGITIALMGDPTLRLHTVAPPTDLTVIRTPAGATLNWKASPDPSVLEYIVLRQQNNDTFAVIGRTPALTFTDKTSPFATKSRYMVRARKLETSASGSYFNLSQGIIARADSTTNRNPPIYTKPRLHHYHRNICFTNLIGSGYSMTVLDGGGRIMGTYPEITPGEVVTLPQDLARGLYYLRVSNGLTHFSYKIPIID